MPTAPTNQTARARDPRVTRRETLRELGELYPTIAIEVAGVDYGPDPDKIDDDRLVPAEYRGQFAVVFSNEDSQHRIIIGWFPLASLELQSLIRNESPWRLVALAAMDSATLCVFTS